jgi:predicted ribosome-associated RNA-binding protein Tma20
LSERDAVSLAVSDVDGGKYRKLIEGIEQLYSVEQITDDKVLVLYQKDQQAIYELYSVPAMARLQQSIIPKIKLD